MVTLAATLASGGSCAELLGRMSRDRDQPAAPAEPPPEMSTRRHGAWTCGAELPWGRTSPAFGLVRRLGRGQAWKLEVDDVDGLALLQVVGHRGRARQGCWTELS